MALITKAIKGTKDVLPQDAYKIQYIEATAPGNGRRLWIQRDPYPCV